MATKKPTTTAKSKTTAAKSAKLAAGQAFDIIPRNKVKPSSTSRPVIRTSKPVADSSTLTVPSGAPTLTIKRRPISIEPQETVEAKEAVYAEMSMGTPTDESVTGPAAEGVSVDELIAKRKGKTIAVAEDISDVAEPAAKTAAAADDKPADSAPEPVPETTEETPTAEPVAQQAPESEDLLDNTADKSGEAAYVDPAAAEAARLLSDTPEVAAVDATPPQPALEDVGSDQADTPAEPVTTDDMSTTQTAAVTTSDPAEPAERTETTHLSVDTSGLESALRQSDGDTSLQPDSASSRHELYGGKPVIIVHKDRGALSALAWVLWFLVCVGLALLIVDGLLDAGVIDTSYNVPHTHFIKH